ncbi:MAG: hypothetical protein DRQ55_01075 [Planctomycetota bacterium]|nr:MAG: hypothetical protein DRQ55_01075 [Planctomycetota bacterium]
MTASGFEGLAPLLRLQRMRLAGTLRNGLRSLKRPKRLLLVLLGLSMVSLFVFINARSHDGGNPILSGDGSSLMLSLFLTLFVGTTVVGAMVHGTMLFSPAEVQFLFPGPVGSRALICAQLLSAGTKAFSGALVFTIFLKPQGVEAWRVLLGYQLVFSALVALGMWVDLMHMRLQPLERKRRGWVTGIGLALALTGVAAATAARDGGWSVDALRWVGLPGRLFAGLISAPDRATALLCLAGSVGVVAGLALACLYWKAPVRAGALHSSERRRAALDRLSKGGPFAEKVQRSTSGRLLPMLPRWGGAGAHAWRQLSSLRRRRKAFGLLIMVPLIAAVSMTLVGDRPRPELGAAMAIFLLMLLGPFYVQCDFRSDHGSLAWLRSLPTSASALAAGQLIASAIVVSGLQLIMGGWGVLLTNRERLPYWVGGLALLPVFNMILLAVENAVWLVHPTRLDYRNGPPGALEIVRMYGVFLAKAVILCVTVGLALLPGFGVHLLTGSPSAAIATAALSLLLETALLVVIVGRLFRWVDPSRDLADD